MEIPDEPEECVAQYLSITQYMSVTDVTHTNNCTLPRLHSHGVTFMVDQSTQATFELFEISDNWSPETLTLDLSFIIQPRELQLLLKARWGDIERLSDVNVGSMILAANYLLAIEPMMELLWARLTAKHLYDLLYIDVVRLSDLKMRIDLFTEYFAVMYTTVPPDSAYLSPTWIYRMCHVNHTRANNYIDHWEMAPGNGPKSFPRMTTRTLSRLEQTQATIHVTDQHYIYIRESTYKMVNGTIETPWFSLNGYYFVLVDDTLYGLFQNILVNLDTHETEELDNLPKQIRGVLYDHRGGLIILSGLGIYHFQNAFPLKVNETVCGILRLRKHWNQFNPTVIMGTFCNEDVVYLCVIRYRPTRLIVYRVYNDIAVDKKEHPDIAEDIMVRQPWPVVFEMQLYEQTLVVEYQFEDGGKCIHVIDEKWTKEIVISNCGPWSVIDVAQLSCFDYATGMRQWHRKLWLHHPNVWMDCGWKDSLW